MGGSVVVVGGLFEVHFSYTGTEVMIFLLLMFNIRGGSIIFFFEKKLVKFFLHQNGHKNTYIHADHTLAYQFIIL